MSQPKTFVMCGNQEHIRQQLMWQYEKNRGLARLAPNLGGLDNNIESDSDSDSNSDKSNSHNSDSDSDSDKSTSSCNGGFESHAVNSEDDASQVG